MKSYALQAFATYDGIISDATARWPHLRASLRKDLSYLRRAVDQRGLTFLTITLPEAAKALMQDLDRGQLSGSSFYPRGLKWNRIAKRPRMFGEVYDLLFDDEGVLKHDADVDAVGFLIQAYCLCKKAKLECHPQRTKETLDEFFAIEEHLPTSHPDTWDSESPKWQDREQHPIWGTARRAYPSGDLFLKEGDRGACAWYRGISLDLLFDDLRDFSRRIVGTWIGDYPEWELEPKHGPGAVSELRKGIKYDFPNWPRRLEAVFPFDWYGSGSLDSLQRPEDREVPSRLIAVPKSQKGPRLICAEPTSHQWIQQGIWRWLEDRVRTSPLGEKIRFRDQTLQQRRALGASMDGKLCTIDLSSASDRISTRLVEYIFGGTNLLDALHACRTRMLSQTISPDHPKMIKLRKFSTMGSAVTFPVQSLLFYIITAWAVKLQDVFDKYGDVIAQTPTAHDDSDDLEPFMDNVGRALLAMSEEDNDQCQADVTVFGDDIIAPKYAYETIKLVLHECGLKVNSAKTFTGDNFRESCGVYAFRGHDVTPAYLLLPYDGSPESLAATIEVSNNLHLRGYWYGAASVVVQIPGEERKKILVTGPDRTGGLGLVSFCGQSTSHLSVRWDANLQRSYVKILTVSSKSRRIKGSGEASLLQYFSEDPAPEDALKYLEGRVWESGQASRPKVRKSLGRVYL